MKVESLPGCARLDSRGRLSLRELCGLIVAVLREIFDESAYQRFLDRSHLQSIAGDGCALRGDRNHREDGPRAIRARHSGSAVLAGGRDLHRVVAQGP